MTMKKEEMPMIVLLVGFILVLSSMLMSGSGIPRVALIVGVLTMNVSFWMIFTDPRPAKKPKKSKD